MAEIEVVGITCRRAATSALDQYRCVSVYDNEFRYASPADSLLQKGILLDPLDADEEGLCVLRGIVTNPAWSWTLNQPVWLAATDGQLTQTEPSPGQRILVGNPMSATKLFVDLAPRVVLPQEVSFTNQSLVTIVHGRGRPVIAHVFVGGLLQHPLTTDDGNTLTLDFAGQQRTGSVVFH